MRSTAPRIAPLARLTFLLAAGLAALLAAAPAVTLWDDTGRALVPWVSPDQYLYLTLSHLRPDAQGLVRNPWYGATIPANDVPDLRFGLALRLFDVVRTAAGGDARALPVWHAGVAIVTVAALFWLLTAVSREQARDRAIALVAFAAIMWIDPRDASADLRRFASPAAGWIHGLPWSRLFYPQVAVAPILFALGCVLRWMPDRRHPLLIGIVAAQLLVFMALPDAAIVIAGSVVTIAVAALLLRAIDVRGAVGLVMVAIVSLSLDAAAAFVLTGRVGVSLAPSGDRQMILPLAFGAIALAMPSVDRPVRAVLGGFGIAMGLIQFVHHVESFYTLAFWLPLIPIAMAIASRVPATIVRGGAGVATAALIAFAILDVRAATTAWRPFNRANGELARAFGMLDLTPDDVVVTPVHGFETTRFPVHPEASWVPLVRPATVLYTPAGKRMLPPGSTESAERLAAYLYLEGEDVRSVRAMLAAPAETTERQFLAGYGRELEAPLQALDAGTLPRFLRVSQRLIVADYKDDPIFKTERIERLFVTERVVRTGAWRITIAVPR